MSGISGPAIVKFPTITEESYWFSGISERFGNREAAEAADDYVESSDLWAANHANRIPVLTAFRFGDEINHAIVHQRLQRASAASAAQSVANSQPVPAEPDWFFRNLEG